MRAVVSARSGANLHGFMPKRDEFSHNTPYLTGPLSCSDRICFVNYADVREYLNSKAGAVEDYPFGPDALVMKVRGKMFALLSERAGEPQVNLKCDPHEAAMLRDIFPAVLPGYHMNKKHWNTVLLDGSVPEGEVQRMIDVSWRLVVAGLPKRERDALALIDG